jgi:ATP-dependent DNA helicase RecG
MYLEDLDLSLNAIKGIGPEGQKDWASLGIINLRQLLQHYPMRYDNRLDILTLASVEEGIPATYVVEVVDHRFINAGKERERVLKVEISDGTASAYLVCFGRNFLADKLIIGNKFYLFTTFQWSYEAWQASSFEFEAYSESPTYFKCLSAVYRLAGKLTQHKVSKAIAEALKLLPERVESLVPTSVLTQLGLSHDKKTMLQMMHLPANFAEVAEAKRWFVAEELFFLSLALSYRRRHNRQPVRSAQKVSAMLLKQLLFCLPFEPTSDQKTALKEIFDDFSQSYPMRRLLQGDVGSGKTLVAFMAATAVLERNQQVVLLAPTELLARQHAHNADLLFRPLGVEVAFLTGNIRANGRKELLSRIATGQVQFIVGTHAVFSNDVHYHYLGFIVVDEQHRFGVAQRERLLEKGPTADLLLMTATPIPRTLALTQYGDMAISSLYVMPAGRGGVKTHLVAAESTAKVYEQVHHALALGQQAYFVYPLIDEAKNQDRQAAQTMFTQLQAEFSEYSVGLLHSRLDEEEKKQTMQAFVVGKLNILVATSVVEVGVDVPNATIMVIAEASRFGLAALHQLRGRIGRGALLGRCFLCYRMPLSDEGKQRLKIIYEINDGFRIAEEDLKLRGMGHFLGYRQSGNTELKLTSLEQDQDLWQEVEQVVEQFMTSQLESEYPRLYAIL